jgi:hypothetical protein
MRYTHCEKCQEPYLENRQHICSCVVDRPPVKIIKTPDEYNKVIDYISELMDAEPYSQEEDDLDLFSVLAVDYERENFPIGDPVCGPSKEYCKVCEIVRLVSELKSENVRLQKLLDEHTCEAKG